MLFRSLGGSHIGKPALSPSESIRLIQQAIDRGITFMDNSWDYNWLQLKPVGAKQPNSDTGWKPMLHCFSNCLTISNNRTKTGGSEPSCTLPESTPNSEIPFTTFPGKPHSEFRECAVGAGEGLAEFCRQKPSERDPSLWKRLPQRR